MTNIEANICDAIEIIVNRAIDQASYDRTIQATIVKCVDQTIGKYVVKYQDSTFYAYSGSSEVTYTNGSMVYILIPGNDTEADKTILGTTKKLGINYITTVEADEEYQIVGNNCITSSGTFNLQSYRLNKQVKVLYSKSYNVNQNLITLNKTSVNEYIKNQKTIICGGVVRTNLPLEQQLRGNYGIIFALNFKDNTNNSIVTRYYTIDVDKMLGNPYKMQYDTRQYGIFNIDGENFIEIDSISIFCYDFPNNKPDSQCIDDIFIKDIELYGAERLNSDNINNYSLTFYTPQGIYFDGSSLDSDIKTIEAQVRIKGKVIDNNSQRLPFYWFIEHVGITSESTYYNKYGGQGWKCLNNYTPIKKATSTDPEVVEWIPATYRWTVKKQDILAKEVKYKCAVVYEGVIITKTITIKNLASGYNITIDSSEGTKFYFDTGHPTLKCLVNGKENQNYIYSWAVTNNVGNFETIPDTPSINNDYLIAYNNYNTLLNNIQKELVPLEPNRERLNTYRYELNKYDRITRVDKNTIWHLNVNTITDFSTYRCTVYQGKLYLGTASIVLTNSLTAEGSYTIIINDGSYVYKYDENGVSPASPAIESPIEIKALTFNVYDNLGNQIDDEIVRHSNIQWIVPIRNTMIKIPSSYTEYEEDLEKGVRIYKNFMSFAYEIEDRYDITKNNNNIQVIINYKGVNLSSRTDLVFVKEGDAGTNGTEFFCRIVPNTIPGENTPLYPILTELNDYSWFLNYQTQQLNKFFKVQLWHNEYKILDSVVSARTTEGKQANIKWSILKNKYSANIYDSSSLTVNESTGVFAYSGYRSDSPAHIVKVELEYNGVIYYATLPLITVKMVNNNYRVKLKEGTGFVNAVYSSDGKRPRYDNTNPFELIVTQKINGYDEDISLKTTSTYAVTYSWAYLGRIYEKSWINNINIGDRIVDELKANQKAVKPLDDYDGQCVTNAIEGVVKKSNVEIARIHIPVHLMLNRYGNSAINGWDGNSVNIDKDGGFILAPQVGAGIKENDNSFTGVVIGKVKETNQSGYDIGLIGYAKGVRSIFLDAQTGKAVFGANGKGQITIDPTQNTARIYSGNFLYNSNGTGTGMEIDLTTPQIRFGSGRFEVSKEGYLTAKGGGSIAGWQITNTELYSPAPYANRKITLDSSNIKIYSGTKTSHNLNKDGFYLDPNYFVLGSKFKVFSDGKLEIGTGAYNSGSSKHWIIDGNSDNSYIQYGSKGSTGGVYIGTNEIQLGRGFSATSAGLLKVGNLNGQYWIIASRMGTTNPAFISYNHSVTTDINGELTDGPTINSTHSNNSMYMGTDGIAIGSRFIISANNNKVKISYNTDQGINGTDNNCFYLSTDGLRIGNRFRVQTDSTGTMEIGSLSGVHWTISGSASKAYIAYGGTSWQEANSDESTNTRIYLGTDGISLGQRFSVSQQGILKSYSGIIGGWNISKNKLSASNMEINSNGSIKGGSTYSWSIDSAGTATFKRIKADVGGTIGNCNISSTGIYSDGWRINSNGSASFNNVTITGGSLNINNASKINSDGSANFSNVTITGGSLNIGNAAKIDSNGNASFSNVAITGGSLNINNAAKINSDGSAYFSNVSITGGSLSIGGQATINSNGSASFSNVTITGGSLNIGAAKINTDGSVNFTSGKIGGWTLGANSLTGGNVTLNSSGAITGSGWSISAGGLAKFSNIDITGGKMKIGDNFSVDSSGKLTAKQVSINGEIEGDYLWIKSGGGGGLYVSGGYVSVQNLQCETNFNMMGHEITNCSSITGVSKINVSSLDGVTSINGIPISNFAKAGDYPVNITISGVAGASASGTVSISNV